MVEMTDSIVAIATPPGRGGIGVVRISGPAVKNIVNGLVALTLSPRHAHFCKFRDKDGSVIDEGIAIFFKAPASYTGEDMLEVYTHGSRIVLNQIVSRAIELGARLAKPGEFTERAFHNNKLDLVQAEAVADLVDSVSEHAARSAVRSLEGEFSRRVNGLLEALVDLRTHIEGSLDFPDEDVNFSAHTNIGTKLKTCLKDLQDLFVRAKQGVILKEGITAVILGRPNVGKSTFLNRLAGREAAIVTDEPGTTRDLIEQDILIDDIPVHIIDTAGLRTATNKVEKEGIARAKTAAEKADILIILVEHGSRPGAEEQKQMEAAAENKKVIIVYNKIDLTGSGPEIIKKSGEKAEILLSAKTGEGMDLFVQHLKELLGVQDMFEDVFMARKRHLDALKRTKESIEKAIKLHGNHESPELLAEELRLAQQSLGEITGAFVPDDLLGEIFKKFCIGK
jgi:tRNA modification GTPase